MKKLSPNMQAAMWGQFRREAGQPGRTAAKRTVDALIARGLFEKTGRWTSLSAAGRTWIAEQTAKVA